MVLMMLQSIINYLIDTLNPNAMIIALSIRKLIVAQIPDFQQQPG
jgi:hypothetical protein